ncbi:2-hydroxyacid dehydrogenase [Nocardioides sp. JQ2195]|uniref:2-hydroxyacid dehydrogenase n=1 Tax=Nocardioides sp. JQ2195 TaxID=2592334 RepID=UPI00143EE9C4|nr:2-hydroxyacid dehydrogenase [Nocardioides sp. JQ2195]QIX26678.1 2-hydroxyacid dehydrogenase [Nocardioides sp. JQ2195]
MADPRPLVWLPFDAEHLGEAPDGLRYESLVLEDGAPLPEWAGDVEFYVPPYMKWADQPRVLAALSSLKVVNTLTAGVDAIKDHVPEGVQLCNGRGIHNASTAELAVTLVLASLRGVPDFVRAQDRGAWQPTVTESLADKTVMIVGHGSIGKSIEERLSGFECDVVRVARTARQGVHPLSEIDDLLPGADVVILIVPLTDETRGLVDEGFLERMRDGALLVNLARGPVVDTDALLSALHTGRLSAALDVTDPEPLPEGHPLWEAPNLLVVPHVGGASSAMWPRAHRVIREQLERFASGEPLANVMSGAY